MGSNPGSVKFFFFFFFFFFFKFFFFFFFKYIESVLGSNIAPSPSPHPTFFHFLNIVQYLFVHCTIPSILGSHPHTPHHPTPNIAFTSTLNPAPPTPQTHLTPSATDPPPPPPPDPPPQNFFFEFSQKTSILRSHPP